MEERKEVTVNKHPTQKKSRRIRTVTIKKNPQELRKLIFTIATEEGVLELKTKKGSQYPHHSRKSPSVKS